MESETSTVLMVPPDGFAFNAQTADSNVYQKNQTIPACQQKALLEFNEAVATLEKAGIRVIKLTQDPSLPDAVFPNNWFSTHLKKDGRTDIIVYPMLTENRQAEVQLEKLVAELKTANIVVGNIFDLREPAQGILEGTGSLVLDHHKKVAYALLSERTQRNMVDLFSQLMGYKPVVFHAVDKNGHAIYHTNVIMGFGHGLVIACLDVIKNQEEKRYVTQALLASDRLIIEITEDQVNHMCGNVLGLRNLSGESLLVMSEQAHSHFTKEQLNKMKQLATLVPIDINTIETIGGGSARCMMAEIFHH